MTVIPLQFFGIGDIIFTQTLVRKVANGLPIVWPVLAQFVEGLNRAYPDITFVNMTTVRVDYDRKDQYIADVPNYGKCTILPIRWADTILKVPYTQCMRAKYDLYGLDWQTWKEDAMPDTSNLKFPNLLQPNHEFKLINRYFRSDCSGVADIKKIGLEMRTMGGLSLFDWITPMMSASEIHSVSTSIIYLFELLDIKCPIHLYPRKPDEVDFRNIDYILQKHKYIRHV